VQDQIRMFELLHYLFSSTRHDLTIARGCLGLVFAYTISRHYESILKKVGPRAFKRALALMYLSTLLGWNIGGVLIY